MRTRDKWLAVAIAYYDVRTCSCGIPHPSCRYVVVRILRRVLNQENVVLDITITSIRA